MSQLSKNESRGGSSNPNPGPLIETPIICPIAFTMALPLAPSPLLPIKSTLGGPHLRTFVLQSGLDGEASIASSILSKSGVNLLFNPTLSIILSKLSSIDFVTPPFEEYDVGSGGQLALSQSRTFVRIFANLIAFENVSLGSAIPPP